MRFILNVPRLPFVFLLVVSLGMAHSANSQVLDPPTEDERDAQFGALEAKVEQEGTVRVITLVRASGSKRATLTEELATISTSRIQTYENFPMVAMEVDEAGLDALEKNQNILGIEEDIPHAPTLSESTTLIGANTAWSQGYTGSGQTIAILDTGSHLSHDFIKDKIVGEGCYSKNVTNTSVSLCPSGADSQTGPGTSAACDASVLGSACNHGTGVAGVAAGKRFGAVNFDGVAPDANIISINVFMNYGGSVLSWSSDQIAGLDLVYSLRNTFDIAAANMSLGGGQYTSAADCDAARPATKAAADQLKAAGIAVIAASGNDGYTGSMGAPACISTIISVGSTTKSDAISSFSNHANIVDLMAPGSSITTSYDNSDGFSAVNGTSFSTPTVAGAWAVLAEADPSATVDQILQALKNTGESITGRSGISAIPRIQIDEAISELGCSYAWKMEMAVRDKSRRTTTMNIGQGSVNTDGLDTACGESKAPPLPPFSAHGAVFQLPGDSLFSANDYRSSTADTAEWKLKFSGTPPFVITWDKDNLPAGFFRIRDNVNGAIVNVDMKAVSSFVLRSRSIKELLIQRVETGSCETITYGRGWNLISLPFDPLDDRKTAIFRSSRLALYGYDGTYTVPTRLASGTGYWVFHRRATSYKFCGHDAGNTVAVTEGWNLIAGHDINMATSAITSTPSGIVKTDFFGYNNGYESADSLKQNEAYWVRVSADGVLNVQSSGSKTSFAPQRRAQPGAYTYLNEREADSTWARLHFTDSKGHRQMLFYQNGSATDEDIEPFLLPPAAPGTAFDLRYADHFQVNNRTEAPDSLVLQNFSAPVHVEVANAPYKQFRLEATNTGDVFYASEHRPVTLPAASGQYLISVEPLSVSRETGDYLPNAVALYQNFPNPVQQQPQIRFALPAAAEVSIKVYNVLGQEVAVFLDDFIQAGTHAFPPRHFCIPFRCLLLRPRNTQQNDWYGK